MDYPLVSIVTPSYNQAQFIEETLLSVKGQDYPNLEHIVIDGGSTDGTVDILRRYEDEYNLRWVSEPDEGQADAVNKGWQRASGEILGWINSDDIYTPDAVKIAASALMDNPTVGFVYGDAHIVDSNGGFIREQCSAPFNIEKLLTFDLGISQPTMFLRRSSFETVGLLDTSLEMSMDTDYWFRLGRYTDGLYLPCVMAHMRRHPHAKTVSQYENFFPDALAILEKTFDASDLPEDLRTLRRKAYSRAYYGAAGRAYQAGVRRPILPLAWRAVCHYPHPFDIKTYLSVFMCIEALTGTSLLAKLTAYHPRQRFMKWISEHLFAHQTSR